MEIIFRTGFFLELFIAAFPKVCHEFLTKKYMLKSQNIKKNKIFAFLKYSFLIKINIKCDK